jgi:hypothetical protein
MDKVSYDFYLESFHLKIKFLQLKFFIRRDILLKNGDGPTSQGLLERVTLETAPTERTET